MSEGTTSRCANCGKELNDEDEFWIVTRWKKNLPKFPCPICQKGTIVFEYFASFDKYKIEKDCKCHTEFTPELLDTVRARGKWERTYYHFCGKCFQDQPLKNIMTVEILGEKPKEG